jgi:hypothetical protein
MKEFKKYLDDELPEGFHYVFSPDKKTITIQNDGQYVYLFYAQEIEEDLELCCSLINYITDMER